MLPFFVCGRLSCLNVVSVGRSVVVLSVALVVVIIPAVRLHPNPDVNVEKSRSCSWCVVFHSRHAL